MRAEVDWDPSRQLSGSLSDKGALSCMPHPLQRWEKTYLGEGKRLQRNAWTRMRERRFRVQGGPRAQHRLGMGENKHTKPHDVLGVRFQWAPHRLQLPSPGMADCPAPFTALEDSLVCQNHFCPTDYCYNHGHCYISEAPGCQPTCTCPPAFTDSRCFLAGNDFTPTIAKGMTITSCHPYQPHTSLLPGWECWENQCLRPKFPKHPGRN